MKILIRLESIGSSLGDAFTLSLDQGSVVPNTASRGELLSGLQLEVDNAATSITVTCDSNQTVFISKSIDTSTENCIDLSLPVVSISIIENYNGLVPYSIEEITPTPTPTPTTTPT